MFGELDNYSLKELYDVYLKTTYDMEIAGKQYRAGEVVASFDKINMSALNQVTSRTAARGGYENPIQVIWESTQEVVFSFSQGVFSNTDLALQSNSRLYKITSGSDYDIIIPKQEILESSSTGTITLSEAPKEEIFIYKESTMEAVSTYTISNKTVSGLTAYTEYVIRYKYYYNTDATIMTLGHRLIEGYLRLEAKTRLKEDNTGRVVTALISIPRLKLMSDLSMRLGSEANPVVASFQASGYPVGSKGNKKVMDIIVLDDDIDAL